MKRTVEKEQFFTAVSYASNCLDVVKAHYELDRFKAIVEPSAGTGVFLELLQPLQVTALDIDPQHPAVALQDFLTWIPDLPRPVLMIGNPPFGQRGALAMKFLNRACELADVVAFILPRSFKKYTFLERINPAFHLIDQIEGDEFTDIDGQRREIKTVFQLWERRAVVRVDERGPDSHPDFQLRHAHLSRITNEERLELVSKFKFAIPQVGGKFLPKNSEGIRKGSWWFVFPKDDEVSKRFSMLNFDFCKDLNTAHTSLSKRDIVRAYLDVVNQVLR